MTTQDARNSIWSFEPQRKSHANSYLAAATELDFKGSDVVRLTATRKSAPAALGMCA
jgi:hypothetical protein